MRCGTPLFTNVNIAERSLPVPLFRLQLWPRSRGRTRSSQQTSALYECARTVRRRWTALHAARRRDKRCRPPPRQSWRTAAQEHNIGRRACRLLRCVSLWSLAHGEAAVCSRAVVSTESSCYAMEPRERCPMTPLHSCCSGRGRPRRDGSLHGFRDALCCPVRASRR